ncbi:putative 4Fe-4S ferredoxin-type, iron-sulfur binding domain-containing protein [Helianthus annuus]|nr:putative 4Fe-4S ferredoxin-type, iron-sulfur binding domain-containing protein [Helianthus annuus]
MNIIRALCSIIILINLAVPLARVHAGTTPPTVLESKRLCNQCSKCDTKTCPPSEAYPHMTAFDNTLVAGALQSDYVNASDKGVYSVPNIVGGESAQYNAYFGWKSTSGSASGYHRLVL